ncbi:MAG: ABC transporter permease [Lachnospiraceae bacterium]|nr:ABC transporter permease [Lachnospiraceae bacterium]
MNGRAYFHVQSKRLRILLKIMVPILAAITLLVSLGGYAAIHNTLEQNRMKIRVGICGDTSTPILKMGLSFLTAFDDAQYLVTLLPMEEEDALKALRREELSAYVVIPDGFEDAVNYNLDDAPIRYYSSRGQKGLSSQIMDQIAESISDMIVESNAGVLAYSDALVQDGAYDGVIVESLFLKDMELILRRNELLTYEELGITRGAGTFVYYLLCACLFLLLLFSLAAAPFFYGRDLSFERLVAARGLSGGKQVLLEYAAYVRLGLVWWIFVSAAFGILMLQESGGLSFALMCLSLLGAMLLFFAMHLFLYELLEGVVTQLSGQFFLYLMMAYCSGYFYPGYLLPKSVQRLSHVLPTGMSLDALLDAHKGQFPLIPYLGMLVLSLAFLFCAMILRTHRIRKGGKSA